MVVRSFSSVFALVVVSACSASLDTSLDNKRCVRTHRCLPGYVCSDEGFCERSGDASTLPDSGQDDGGTDSSTAMPIDASSAAPARDASSDVPELRDAEPPSTTAPQSQPDAGQTPPPARGSPQSVPTPGDPPDDSPPQDPETVNPPAPGAPKPPPPPRKDPPKSHPPGGPPPPPRAKGGPDAMGACKPGRTRCGSACVDLEREASSCGACDVACKVDEMCSAGKCIAPTPVGPE